MFELVMYDLFELVMYDMFELVMYDLFELVMYDTFELVMYESSSDRQFDLPTEADGSMWPADLEEGLEASVRIVQGVRTTLSTTSSLKVGEGWFDLTDCRQVYSVCVSTLPP